MNNWFTETEYYGCFQIPENVEAMGRLRLDSNGSKLHIFDAGSPLSEPVSRSFIYGRLFNFTQVSLFKCWVVPTSSFHTSSQSGIYARDVIPQYVIFGDRRLSENDKVISCHFSVNDVDVLFPDYRSFGAILDPEVTTPILERLVKSDNAGFTRIEDTPIVAYFSGGFDIFSVDTALGKVSGYHSIQYGIGGPKGVHIKNEPVVKIQFPKPISLEDAVEKSLQVIRFLGVVAGRAQNVTRFAVNLGQSKGVDSRSLAVHTLTRTLR